MEGSGGKSKVQCYKEQYCIGTCNVRSMNQGILEVVEHKKEYKTCSKGTGTKKNYFLKRTESNEYKRALEPNDPPLIKHETLGTAPLGTSVSSSVKCKQNNLFTG